MPRARIAYADLPVPRVLLADPAQRLRAREVTYRMLTKMGTVDGSTLRYVRDPLDGKLAEQGLPDDETAIIRASALVVPRDS
jgi:hypothetical protein